MTETALDTTGLQFVHLLLYLGEWRPDGTDPGRMPDLVTLGGRVRLTANTSHNMLIVRVGTRPATLTRIREREYTVQASTGELMDEQGEVGVWMPRSDSVGIEPVGWTITAHIQLAGETTWYPITFAAVPIEGDTLNIVEAAEIAPSSGVTSLAQRVAILEQLGETGPIGVGDVQGLAEVLEGLQPAGSYATTSDLAAVASSIPSVAGLASTSYVDAAVAALIVVDPTSTAGLPDGTLIARTS